MGCARVRVEIDTTSWIKENGEENGNLAIVLCGLGGRRSVVNERVLCTNITAQRNDTYASWIGFRFLPGKRMRIREA